MSDNLMKNKTTHRSELILVWF